MTKIIIFLCLLILMITFPFFKIYADSFSCEGGVVSIDDRSSDVLVKCGHPDFRDSHLEEIVQQFDRTRQKVFVNVEEWTYNLGPDQLIRIVVLSNGRIVAIRTGSYGHAKK